MLRIQNEHQPFAPPPSPRRREFCKPRPNAFELYEARLLRSIPPRTAGLYAYLLGTASSALVPLGPDVISPPEPNIGAKQFRGPVEVLQHTCHLSSRHVVLRQIHVRIRLRLRIAVIWYLNRTAEYQVQNTEYQIPKRNTSTKEQSCDGRVGHSSPQRQLCWLVS